jgi:hypothetical protein
MKCQICNAEKDIKHYPIIPVGSIALCNKCHEASKAHGIPCKSKGL